MVSLDRRRFLEAGAAAAGVVAAGAPGLASAQTRKTRVRVESDFNSLDPGRMVGYCIPLQMSALGMLASPGAGEELSWQPSAFVDELEQVDATHIRFKLKPGIVWSNGYGTLSAEDVKFSYERMLNMDWAGKWASLDHVEVAGELEGTIVLKVPFSPIWYTTILNGTGAILCKKAVEDNGGEITTSFLAECGPYLFSQWQPKVSWRLTRNPDWTGPQPWFDEFEYVVVEDYKAAELAFEAGELDMTRLATDSVPRVRDNLPAGSRLVEKSGTQWTWLGMNTEHPLLADIRVRKAIQSAIDVDSILEAAYANASPPAYGIIIPGLIGHRTSSNIAYDPDKARALLAEAGVSDLKLTLATESLVDRVAACTIIQANLAEVGIEVDVLTLDPGVFWALGLESEGDDWKDLQLYLIRYGDAPDPSQPMQWYVSSQVGVWNWERWSNEEFDRLYDEGIAETDPDKRNEIYIRMQEIMEETGAYVWITFEPSVFLVRDNLVPDVWPGAIDYPPGFKET